MSDENLFLLQLWRSISEFHNFERLSARDAGQFVAAMTDQAPIRPVVLSGGSGTRLWPLSSALRPKQLLQISSAESLFQQTMRRMGGDELFEPPVIICNDDHRFLVAEQVRETELPWHSIVLEPVGRNTAPAVAVSCLLLAAEDPKAIAMVVPSDHLIDDAEAFYESVKTGLPAARDGQLVVFGITPRGPEPGFGYIRRGSALKGRPGVDQVAHFTEKPTVHDARAFLETGEYLWNSGMFLFRADRLLAELERWEPAMLAACRAAVAGAQGDLHFLRLGADAFRSVRGKPIDKAVMERTDSAAVVPAGFGWSDVGSWAALWDVSEQDQAGNATQGDVLLEDTKNSYVHSTGRTVAAMGVEDMVIVETEDAVLVTSKARSQDVRAIVAQLESRPRGEVKTRAEVTRPWGSYKSIESGDCFQVKWLKVSPGHQLSAQLHQKRSEHWVVVSGHARVTIGDRTFDLEENESAFVPRGTLHRLTNPSDDPLTVIEVQHGSYLGEDDIIRFGDDYGRETETRRYA